MSTEPQCKQKKSVISKVVDIMRLSHSPGILTLCCSYVSQSARKNALQVIAEYEGTPAEAVEVPDLTALRQLYGEKNPAVPTLR